MDVVTGFGYSTKAEMNTDGSTSFTGAEMPTGGGGGSGTLYDYLDTLSMVYWKTDEPVYTALACSDGDPNKAMYEAGGGTPTHEVAFSTYPSVKGITFDGICWFKGADSLDLSDTPLVTQGDETVIVFTNFSAFSGTDFHVLFSVTGDGGTSAYNTTSEIFAGASDDFYRSRWQYGSGSTTTVVGDATTPTGETILFATRDVTANEVKFYYDNAGTLTQLGTTKTYTNDPAGGSSAVKAACFGGRNKTGNVKPMQAYQTMGLPCRANTILTSGQMQEIINKARA